MDNKEVIAPTTLELKKMHDELEEKVARLAFILGGVQAENEQLKRKFREEVLSRNMYS